MAGAKREALPSMVVYYRKYRLLSQSQRALQWPYLVLQLLLHQRLAHHSRLRRGLRVEALPVLRAGRVLLRLQHLERLQLLLQLAGALRELIRQRPRVPTIHLLGATRARIKPGSKPQWRGGSRLQLPRVAAVRERVGRAATGPTGGTTAR